MTPRRRADPVRGGGRGRRSSLLAVASGSSPWSRRWRFFLAIYLYPLSRLLAWSFFSPGFTLEHYAKLFGEPAYLQAFRNTAEISVWVTVLALVARLPARLPDGRRCRGARARILIVLVLVPFWTSVLVRTFAWMVILGQARHHQPDPARLGRDRAAGAP